jgi:hypothetical protein
MNICIQLPLRLPKMPDQKSLTRRWFSFAGSGRECISLVFDFKGGQYIRKRQWYSNDNILRLAIGYLNATINWNARRPEPDIGPDGSSQTRHNSPVGGFGSEFGPPRCSGSGFCTALEPNQTIFAVRIWTAGGLPGPIANTTLTLSHPGLTTVGSPELPSTSCQFKIYSYTPYQAHHHLRILPAKNK